MPHRNYSHSPRDWQVYKPPNFDNSTARLPDIKFNECEVGTGLNTIDRLAPLETERVEVPKRILPENGEFGPRQRSSKIPYRLDYSHSPAPSE